MALRFTTTAQAAAAHGVKVLTYGPSGVGKTRLCATAPAPLVLSAEAGLLSLRSQNIPAIEIRDFSDLQDAYGWCSQAAEARQFATFCIDSASEIAERVLEAERAKSKDPRKAYGEMQSWVLLYLKQFRDLPGKHVYFSAKQGSVKDEAQGLTLYGPSMPGQQLGPALPYLFDEVFQLGSYPDPNQPGKTYTALRTRRNMQFEAKDRSGKLEEFEQPHLQYIFEKILSA